MQCSYKMHFSTLLEVCATLFDPFPVRESCASASVPFPGTVCVQPLLVHEAQLHDLLAVYGRVQSVWTDPMSNTGYVKFSSIEEASSVVREDRAHH